MGWINVLARTYDNCLSEVGKVNKAVRKYGKKEVEETIVLLPQSHLTINAIAEIRLKENGEFIGANKVDKADQITIVPVTEDSGSRSSGITPMPLCDKLSYIAGDYDDYAKEDKSKRACYEAYMQSLHPWADLADTPVKVKAICNYLDKGSVMKDLTAAEVYDGTDGFVRFIVVNESNTAEETKTWLNEEIYKSFIAYYNSTLEDIGIDYTTGEECAITQKLPAKIRNSGDKAKIISSNDTTNFTFKGRFTTAAEAASIGYEISQKAHNALRWLIAKQGYRNDSESIICWSPGGEPVPSPMENTDKLVYDFDDEDEEDEVIVDTEETFAKKLNKAIAGYQQNFDKYEKRINEDEMKVVVMAVDTADGSGQGRLSITYYNEQHPKFFLDNIFKWHNECSWIRFGKMGAPSPKDIILAAYGAEKGAFLEADGKLVKKNVDRLLPCIVQGKKIPKDIVYAAVRNAGNPQRFSDNNWNRLLADTCAIIVKYQNDYGKEVFKVALNKESTDRDYLFGRLLAVTHRLEEYVNYKSGNEGRETNAMKYWSVYAQKPAKTYMNIRKNLQSYITKLNSGSRNYYLELAEEIFDKLAQTDSFNNEPLKENYLLGYYSQSAEFRKNNSTNNNEEEN